MRAFTAVFTRELAERRLVFPVALGGGFVAILVSALTGWSRPGAADVRLATSVVAAAAFVLAFGIGFGGAAIAVPTADRRLSFFFSRPISASAIWAGKLAGALVLTIGPALLAVLPGLLVSGDFRRSSLAPSVGAGSVAAVFLVGALLLLLGAHAAVTVARLRSPWIAFDVLLAGLGAAGLLLVVNVLLRAGVLPAVGFLSTPLARAVVGATLLALLAASAVQVAVGRTDARRAHGAFSTTLWAILGCVLVALGAYAGWVSSARAGDLASVEGGVVAAPRGSWIEVGGPLGAGRGAGTFLCDAGSRRSLRVYDGLGVVFSQDGAHAAWGEPRFGFFERKDNRLDLFVADLAAGRPVATGLEVGGWAPIAISPSGRRLAVLDGRTLSAYDLAAPGNPRLLAAFPLEGTARAVAFPDEDTVRLFPRVFNASNRKDFAPADFEIAELSLPSKKSVVTGRFERETAPWLRLSADGRFLVGTRRTSGAESAEWTLTLHDGRTGALLATLGDGLRSAQARFLSGGRLVVAGIAGGKGTLKIFLEGEEGRTAPTRMVDLGPAARIFLGGEIAPGRVAVSLFQLEENLSPVSPRSAKLAVVDVASGAVSPLGEGLVPADRFAWWQQSILPPSEAGAPASSLFLDADSRLVRLDPATGARTVLLGRSK